MADDTHRATARLGRGLAALLGERDNDFPAANDRGPGSRRVPIEFLRRNPRNPRSVFPEADLVELADSIRERGIIQPIVVRALPDLPDVFEIIAGERRWRAAQRAGLHDVPTVVVEADDRLALELAIIENIQRSDLNALDEAGGYEILVAQHGYSQTDLANALGKSRSHIANSLRLLKLPPRTRQMLADGAISAGHGRALLAVADPDAVAERIVERELTVRDVERLGRDEQDEAGGAEPDGEARKPGRPRRSRRANAVMRELAEDVGSRLGLPVRIDDRDGEGEVQIRYGSIAERDRLVALLRGSAAGR